MKRLLPILFVFLLPSVIAAQETTETPDEGWPVEQRCLPEATKPPEGWRFDGTIIMNGAYGIHGYNANWEMPRVLAFTNVTRPENGLIDRSLSPDMMWYAAAEANYWCSGSCNAQYWYVTRLHVFNLSGDHSREVYSMEWKFDFTDTNWEFNPVTTLWLDNEHIVYNVDRLDDKESAKSLIVNPFTGEIRDWTEKWDPYCRTCSPDHSRDIIYEVESEDYLLYDVTTGEAIARFDDKLFTGLPDWVHIWTYDSKTFIGGYDLNDERVELALHNRNGEVIDRIMTVARTSDSLFDLGLNFDIDWSPNGHFFVLSVDTDDQRFPAAYVVDVQERRIFDLCFPANFYTAVWSPDSTQLAFVDESRTDKPGELILFDIGTWRLYSVAYHSSEGYAYAYVIGWRAGE